MATERKNKTRLNSILRHMRQRCKNPNDSAFKNYGAKGIKVCKEWDEDFLSFYNWAIQNGYEDGLTIDRIDSTKGYEPSNCEWVTRAENCRRAHEGKRYTKPITFNGRTLFIDEWAEELGITPTTLRTRLNSSDWTLEEALTIGCYGKPREELITFKGRTKPLSEWADEIGLSASGLYNRLHGYGWSVEKALTSVNKKGKPSCTYDFNGKSLTLIEWSEETGIPRAVLYQRIYKGWSIEKALTTVKPKDNPSKPSDDFINFNGKTLMLKDWAKQTNIPYMVIYNRLNRYGWSVDKSLTTPVRAKRS